MIIAVFVPDFVLALERANNPTQQHVPLLVYQPQGNGRRVVAMCSVAKQQGILYSMSRTRAHGLCPEAMEVDAHPSLYRSVADELCNGLLAFSDRLEREISSGLIIWLDLGKQGHSESVQHARAILAYMRETSPSSPRVGGARGRSTARIVAFMTQDGQAQVLPMGHEQAFLKQLSLSQFQTTKRFQEQCSQLGLKRLVDLGSLPYTAIKTRLGEEGAQLHRLYQGVDRTTIDRFTVPLHEEAHRSFDIPVEDTTILSHLFRVLADELARKLQAANQVSSEITLRLLCDDKSHQEASRILRVPIYQASAIREEVERLLAQLELSSGVVSLSIRLDKLTPPAPQQLDFFDDLFGNSQPFVEQAVAQLMVRHEATPLVRVGVPTVRSFLPERNRIVTPVQVA